MAHPVSGGDICGWLLDACGYDGKRAMVRRIIMDVNMDSVVTIYVETYADGERLQLRPPDLRGAEVVVLDGPKQ